MQKYCTSSDPRHGIILVKTDGFRQHHQENVFLAYPGSVRHIFLAIFGVLFYVVSIAAFYLALWHTF